MKKILFATDFSENAEKALKYALKMAQSHHAELIMMHVFDIPTSWKYPHIDDAVEMKNRAAAESKDKLKALFGQYSKDIENIKVGFIASESATVVEGIIAAIKENVPELLVVGTKGGNRAREIIVGSTSKALIGQSPCPVLSIPEKAVDGNLKKIMYATDFFEDDIKALRQLISLVQPFNPEIIITHVNTPQEYGGDEKMEWFKDLLKEKISYDKIKFELLLADDVYEGLNSYLNRHKFDLLAMLEKEHNGIIDKLFHSDLVKKMEFHTSSPLLSFNERYLHASS
jgi:nucleotide-binding universal stress UspA family protein